MSEVFSELGKIQADFNTFRLRDVLTLSDSGVWGDELEPNTDGTKVIRSTNFTNTGELDLSDVAVRKIAKDKALEKKLLNGDILIERSGGSDTQPVGRVAFSDFEIEKSDYAFANFIQRIRFNNEVDPRFVFYCLLQMHQMGATESIQNQTTGIRNLDLKSYLRVELPKPEKNEQVRISSLLSQVDNVIQKTKDSIAQAQQLKKALMQHLLSGRLKPDGTWRKPDEFYVDEKFGRVPKGWNYLRLRDVLNSQLVYGANTSAIPYSKDFPRFIRITDIDDAGNLLEDTKVSLDPEIAKSYMLEENDFLFARTGNSVGRTFLYKNAYGPSAFAGYLVRAKLNQSLILPEYLNNLCLSQYFDSFKVSMARVGAKPNINAREFSNFRFMLPERIDEQDQIAKSIYQFTFLIEAKTRKINYLIKIKKSLMQNLLTGKIRVQAE